MLLYEYPGDEIIKQLKKDLMVEYTDNDNNYSYEDDDISTTISKKVKDIINDDAGIVFEDNIRKTLEYAFGWKPSKIPRNFFYREIIINRSSYILKEAKKLLLEGNEEDYLFMLNEKYDCEIFRKSNEKLYQKIKAKSEEKINIGEINIYIKPKSEIEIDGLYKVNCFDLNQFDQEEVNIIYNNCINIEEINFVAIEMKLNKKKIGQIISQLKKDEFILDKLINKNKNILYLGIINSGSLNFDYKKMKKELKNINCIILGIKNSFFCKRKITMPIDWNLICEVDKIKKEVDNIKDDVDNIKDDVDNIKDDVDNIKDDVNNIKDDVNNIKNDVDNIKNDVKNLNNKVDNIEKKFNNFSKDLTDIKNILEKMDNSQRYLNKKRKAKK
jgi:uncharacterized protein YoxC